MSERSYNHGQAVGHGDKISTASLRSLLLQIAESRRAKWILGSSNAILIVLQAEFASILAHNRDVAPSKSGESLTSNLTQRRREIHKVDPREEFRNVDVLAHCLNVPASTTTDL